MNIQRRIMIISTVILLAIMGISFWGYIAYSLQVDKIDNLKIALDAENAKTEVLREEVDAIKLENNKIKNAIDQLNQLHLDEMDQLLTSNERKLSQIRELLSQLSDIEVRQGKILNYMKTDQFVLEVDFEDEIDDGDSHMIQIPAETSVFVIDVIGPIRVNQANLIELLDSTLSTTAPQYEIFTFIYVNDKLIQIYQGQIEL